jgi:hypothetical protein
MAKRLGHYREMSPGFSLTAGGGECVQRGMCARKRLSRNTLRLGRAKASLLITSGMSLWNMGSKSGHLGKYGMG